MFLELTKLIFKILTLVPMSAKKTSWNTMYIPPSIPNAIQSAIIAFVVAGGIAVVVVGACVVISIVMVTLLLNDLYVTLALDTFAGVGSGKNLSWITDPTIACQTQIPNWMRREPRIYLSYRSTHISMNKKLVCVMVVNDQKLTSIATPNNVAMRAFESTSTLVTYLWVSIDASSNLLALAHTSFETVPLHLFLPGYFNSSLFNASLLKFKINETNELQSICNQQITYI